MLSIVYKEIRKRARMARDGPAAQRLQAHFSSCLSAATRGHVVPFREEFGEVALAGKSAGERDVGYRALGFFQQAKAHFQTVGVQEIHGSPVYVFLEQLAALGPGHESGFGYVSQGYLFRIVFPDIGDHATLRLHIRPHVRAHNHIRLMDKGIQPGEKDMHQTGTFQWESRRPCFQQLVHAEQQIFQVFWILLRTQQQEF